MLLLIALFPQLFSTGVLRGEAGMLMRPEDGFIPGYMILMRDGDGDGAREEKVLETTEAAVPTSQC